MPSEIEQKYTGLLGHLRTQLESEEFQSKHKEKENDFIRERCLTFCVVVLLLVNMMKRSLQDELDEFFKVLNEEKVASRQVGKSAFSQARKKLKASAFIELNQEQVRYFYEHFSPETWQGYRLLAVDGTLLDVPDTPSNREEFGVWGSRHDGKGSPKVRVSQLFDVHNQLTIDAQISPKSVGERQLALRHLAFLSEDDLLLIDRGYPAFWFFAAILRRNAQFCARIDGNNWDIVKDFIASGQSDSQILLTPTHDAKKMCKSLQLPIDPLALRLVRVTLPSGQIEVLITSLIDSTRFPSLLFQPLYQLRWPVEEDYKCIQSRFEIENWSGTTSKAVYQDFHATIFTKNLAAIFQQPAQLVVLQTYEQRKHDYKVNMTNLISKLKNTVVLLFWEQSLAPLFQALWAQMIRTVEPIRPNRSFERNKKVKRRRFPMNYKPTR